MNISKKMFKTSLIMMLLILVSGPAWAISGQEKARPAQETKAWNMEPKTHGSALLNPGETALCKKNFRVTNVGKGRGAVQIIMGNGDNYYWTVIDPNQSVSYDLGKESIKSTVGHLAETDEARIVNTTMGDAMIRVDCSQM